MKDKKKWSRMEKFLIREYERKAAASGRFLETETRSFPCGRNPGAFISEHLQSHNDRIETDPFCKFAAKREDLLEARRIYGLSRQQDSGACVISFDKWECSVNGSHYAISDSAYVQIRTQDPDMYYSLAVDVSSPFAADIYTDSFSGRCFIMIETADSGRICIPLNEVRFLSVGKQKNRRGNTGRAIEYTRSSGIYDTIVCGPEMEWIRQRMKPDENGAENFIRHCSQKDQEGEKLC